MFFCINHRESVYCVAEVLCYPNGSSSSQTLWKSYLSLLKYPALFWISCGPHVHCAYGWLVIWPYKLLFFPSTPPPTCGGFLKDGLAIRGLNDCLPSVTWRSKGTHGLEFWARNSVVTVLRRDREVCLCHSSGLARAALRSPKGLIKYNCSQK